MDGSTKERVVIWSLHLLIQIHSVSCTGGLYCTSVVHSSNIRPSYGSGAANAVFSVEIFYIYLSIPDSGICNAIGLFIELRYDNILDSTNIKI